MILVYGSQAARADYRYWTDAVGDNLWSTAGNWSPQIAPISGDILVFGDGNHDNGKSSGFTINDIPNLNIQQLIVGSLDNPDNNGFTIESTVGPLSIYGGPLANSLALIMNDAEGDVGLTVQCPLVLENGAGIYLFTQNGGTTVNFNDAVNLPSGGVIDGVMQNNGTFTPDTMQVNFNSLLSSGGDLKIIAETYFEDKTLLAGARVNLTDVNVDGDLSARTDGDYSWVRFAGSNDNFISGSLYLACAGGHGKFLLQKPSNSVVASSIDVHEGAAANLELDAPGNIGTVSTLTIEQGAVVNLSGADAAIGGLVLKHQSADATPPILNTGSTVPEFGLGSTITVIQDSTHGNPTINGRIHLDFTQIDISGAVPSFLDINASAQGSGFYEIGSGTLLLNGANTFTQGVLVYSGTLQPKNPAALNIPSTSAVYLQGGTLQVQNFGLPNTPLSIESPSTLVAFTPCTWAGPIILKTNATLTIVPVDLNLTNAELNFSGPISGAGGLNLVGLNLGFAAFPSVVELSGSSANTFTGPLFAGCQLLKLNKPANVSAFRSVYFIAGGPGGVGLGEVRWLNSGQGYLPNVTVYSNCVLNLNNFNDGFYFVDFYGGEIETGNGQITIEGPVTVHPTGVTATIAGSLSITEFGNYFNVYAGGVDPDLWIQASVTGTPSKLIKAGPGIMRLSGANNFAASTEVQQGVLEVGNSRALGNFITNVTVDAGATLQTEPGVAIANPISMAGGLVVPAGQSVVLTGNITLQGPTTINVTGSLLIDAPISGTGGLTKTGSGSLSLGGITANTYTGDTQVSGGTLSLGKPNSVYAVPGNLIIGGSGFHSTPAKVFNGGDSTIGGSITVNGGSLWHLDGHVHIFNSSNLLGQVPLTLRNGGSVETSTGALLLPGGDDVAVIPGNNGTSIIDGNLLLHPGPNNFIVGGRSFAVAGPECRITANIGQTADLGGGATAQLTKSSFGTLVLTGTNNYGGNTIVSNGVLEIDGSQPQSLVQVYAGTLQGNGTVGPLELNDPNAVVAPLGLPSTLVCSNFNEGATPNGTLQIYLAGNQPGTGYSQVRARDTVSLANLNLNASLSFYPAYGAQFTIIKNDGPAGIVGTFTGLPEGFIFPISGELFQISYVGASGKDVVLTHLSPTNQVNVANWINGSGGDWNTGANWDTGTVPNGGNAVVAIGSSCTITNNANVSVAQLLYNSPLCTITGSGNFTMSGLFDWQAGAFNGSGNLMANGGLHLDPQSSTNSLTGESLINSGPATWSASTAINLSGGTVLSNAASGTFDCAGDGSIQNGPGTNLLANAGLFRKINSTGTTTILVPFNNSGTVQVQSGTLDLAGGGTSSGNFEVSSGASLSFSAATNTLGPGSSITGAGEFHILNGTANLFGTVTTLGPHNFLGGILNLGGNYNPGNNDITIGACTVNFNGTTPVTAASLTVGGYGSLGGSNLISVSGPMVWNSSFAITGSNSLIANGGLTIGPGGSLFGRTLVNMASASWTNSGIGSLVLGGGAVISNAPGATFDCMGNNFIVPTSGSGTVANAGLFRTIGPPATNTIEVPFNNSGTLEVQSGTLNLSGGGMNTGTISVFANATLSLGEQFSLAPGGNITGPGELLVTGSTSGANLDGTVNLSGSNIFNGGVANLTGNYVCSNVALTIGPGTANFNSSNVISPSSLALGGYGFLGGSNLVTVGGPMTWNSGFTITGTNNVVANGGLTIGPGNVTLDGRTLVNMGLGVWTNNTAGLLLLIDGAVLSNAPSGTFECVGNGTIGVSTGGGLVANAGLFQTIGAPATNIIQAPFSNNAVVEVQSGLLSLADGGSSISSSNSVAEIDVFPNATLDFGGGTFFLGPTAIIDGEGNLSVSGGTANLAGEVELPGTHTFSRGTANLTGLYNCVSNALVISGGTANFNGSGVIAPSSLTLGIFGTLGGSNLVTVNGPMTWGTASTIAGANSVIANGGLTIGSGVALSGRTLVNAGPALWTNDVPGGIVLSSGAVLSNAPGATFDCAIDGSIDNSSGSNVIFNAGLFRKIAGTNTTRISVPFINAGVVEADSGWLNFVGPFFVQDGGAVKLKGGNVTNTFPMQLIGGVLQGNGVISGSVSNAGTVSPGASPGQITIAADYTQLINGKLIIEIAGTNAGSTFDRLIVNHRATLDGTLNVSLLNGFYPAANSSFTFLISSNQTGTFTPFNYPSNDVGLALTYTATNATVQVINTRPVIPPIANQTATNGSLFHLTVQARDDDLPPQILTYALTNSPLEASIDPNGVVTWTPNFATVPTTASMTVLVRDNGTPSLTASRTFLIKVSNSLNPGTGPLLSFQTGPLGTHSNTLTLLGLPGLEYVAQYATNLAGPWINFMTNIADTNGFWSVIDPSATNPIRFYRTR